MEFLQDLARDTGTVPKPLLKRPQLTPEAAPIRAAFSRLSASRLSGHNGVPMPLQMSDLIAYITQVVGVKDRQELTFHIDIMQALDGLWLEKAYSRLS